MCTAVIVKSPLNCYPPWMYRTPTTINYNSLERTVTLTTYRTVCIVSGDIWSGIQNQWERSLIWAKEQCFDMFGGIHSASCNATVALCVPPDIQLLTLYPGWSDQVQSHPPFRNQSSSLFINFMPRSSQ